MTKFMDVHSGFVGVTEDQLRQAHERDLAIEVGEGVHFERVARPGVGQGVLPVIRAVEGSGAPGARESRLTRTAEIYELPVEVA